MPLQAEFFGKLKRVETNRDESATLDEILPNVSALFVDRQEPASAYYVPVCIQGIRVDALVDTGACVTLLSEEFFKSIPNINMEPSPNLNLEGISQGSKLNVVGSVRLPIKIGNFISDPQEILIVKGVTQCCLLGMNFLDKFGISVNTCKRCLTIAGSKYEQELPVKVVNLAKEHKVVSVKQVELPARCAIPIDVMIPDLGVNIDGCIEGKETDTPSFLIPRSLHSIRNDVTRIECLNITDTPLVIQKGQLLGSFNTLSVIQSCSVEEGGGKNEQAVPLNMPELFDLTDTDLTEAQKEVVYELLRRNSNVIGSNELDLGLTNTVEHRIELLDDAPVKQPYRRFPTPLQKELREEIDKLLDLGVIEPSNSAWSSPLVPVRKKNGALRMCIDYRMLNSRTKKDSFPLPNLADSVTRFRGCEYFSSLDLLAGYHQIPVEQSSRELTAFSDGQNLYQYARMPFGVCNGPASFSRLVAVVLSGIPFDVANAYLDDILVAGKNFEDHVTNMQLVFTRLAEHGLKLSATKCSLFRSEVEYLGHIVGRDGIRTLDKNVKAITDFPRPDTVKQLRSFNGMVNYYRKFLEGSHEVMRPLYKATSGKKLVWTEECEKAFVEAKRLLTNAPLLAYPDFSEDSKFIVTCDASGIGAGATLSQIQHGEEKIIAYAGTSFNEAQLRYSPTDRELAAIRYAVNHFKAFLYGRTYTIRTDHEPLVYLYHMRRYDDRLHRTMEDLNIGFYELEYVPGKSNTIADALSRAAYPWKLDDDDARVCLEPENSLDNFREVEVVGGGDSLFMALAVLLRESDDTANTIRDRAVTRISKNPERYGYRDNTRGRREIDLLRLSSQFPPVSVVQAVADELKSNICVHFESGPTMLFKCLGGHANTLRLKCCGGVHFNALLPLENTGGVCVLQSDEQADAVPPLSLSSSKVDIRQAQVNDVEIVNLRNVLQSDVGDELGPQLVKFKSSLDRLSVDNEGIVVFETRSGKLVPVIPGGFLRGLATELHEVMSHAGRDKTRAVMIDRFFHPDLPKITTDVVRECQVCQRHKGHPTKKHPVYRRSMTRPYEMYAVDLMDLPKSKRGFKCVLTGVDLYTKFAHAVPLRGKTSKAVSRAMETLLATFPKIPEAVLSDNGPEFRGASFKNLLGHYGVKQEFSIPYAPNTNGAIERFNRTLKARLATASDGMTRRWDQQLHKVVAQYNRTPHDQTKKAPVDFFVTNSDIIVPTNNPPKVWREARNHQPFKVGDFVLRRTPYQPAGERDKLAPKFLGPYKVVIVDPNHITYTLESMAGDRKRIVVHQSQIKRYHGQIPTMTNSTWTRRRPEPVCPRSNGPEPAPRRDIFQLDYHKLRHLPIGPNPVNGHPNASSSVYADPLGNPIPINWSVSSNETDDEGVLSDGCRRNSSPFSGFLSVSVDTRPHVTASTPVRRTSHRNFRPNNMSAINFDPLSPMRVSGDIAEPSNEISSVMRDFCQDPEFEVDMEGCQLYTEILGASINPEGDLTADLDRLKVYYSLGIVLPPSDYEDHHTGDLTTLTDGCLPCRLI